MRKLSILLLALPLLVSFVQAKFKFEGRSDKYGQTGDSGQGSKRGLSIMFGGNAVDKTHAVDVSANIGPTTRIVGGNLAPSGRYPYFVHLEIITNVGRFQCGGTLIYEDIVATAAHCFVDRVNEGLTIDGIDAWVGLEDINRKDLAIFRQVANAVPNSGYDGFLNNNDIMVLKLTSPVTSVTPVLLNFQAGAPTVGTPVKIFGFGALQEGGQFSSTLQEATVAVIAFETCNSPTSYNGTIVDEIMICAGVPSGTPDSCLGDSGSAVIVETLAGNPAGDVQVGITSFGNGCARPGFPGGYTRISAYQQFLVDNVCSLANNPPPGCSPTLPPTPNPVITATPPPTPPPTLPPTTVVTSPPVVTSCNNIDGKGSNPAHCSCVGNCASSGKGFFYNMNFGKGKGKGGKKGNNIFSNGKGKGGKGGKKGSSSIYFSGKGGKGGKGGSSGKKSGKGGGKRARRLSGESLVAGESHSNTQRV